MITSVLPTFCKICLRNYTPSENNPSELIPVCDCEEKYNQVMAILRDIEQ